MNRQSVSSSNLRSVGYDEASGMLEIEFKHGGVYLFADVPRALYDGLMVAGSKGKFFNAYIKGRYPFERPA